MIPLVQGKGCSLVYKKEPANVREAHSFLCILNDSRHTAGEIAHTHTHTYIEFHMSEKLHINYLSFGFNCEKG